MDQNPYSAPKTPVADPSHVPVERPRVVTRAVHLLWISWLTGVAAAIDSFSDAPNDATSQVANAVFVVIWLAVPAWLIYNLSRGRRWARTTYTLLAAISYGLLAFTWSETLKHIQDEPYQIALLIAGAATELTALYWLFTKPASAWFAQPTRPSPRERL